MKIFILFLLLTSSFAGQKNYGPLKIESVVRVYDGDTFYANLSCVHPIIGDTIGIRISGIDTPERRGSEPCVKEFAYKVRDYVKKRLMEAKMIELLNCRRGKYFRIIADVYVDGVNLSQELITKGYAKPYSGGAKMKWTCNQLGGPE